MKLVHTFWTKNAGENLRRFKGGWSGELQHYCSWVLSAWQAKKTHDNISLVTDKAGAKLFLNVLRLPYDSVDTSLEQYRGPGRFWSAAKVYSYGLQKDPFVHIDGDVILWNKLPDDCLAAPVLVQSLEHVRNVPFMKTYVRSLRYARSAMPVVPECWNRNHFNAYNCGFFGGCDLEAIGSYVRNASGLFAAENDGFWDAVTDDYSEDLNRTIERWTAFATFAEAGTSVRCLTDSGESSESGGGRLGFQHVMGAKRDYPSLASDGTLNAPALIIDTVKQRHPNTYYRLLGWLKG
jgi:hypothetical protein